MTLATRVIPCLDVADGRVVKGVRFEGLVDAGDPVESAARYAAQGADEITFLDVTATVEGRGTMLDTVRRTAEQVFVPLTVGGGVRSVADVDTLLKSGRRQDRRELGRDRPARAPRGDRGPLRRPGAACCPSTCCATRACRAASR